MDFTGLHRTLCPAKQSNLRACTVGRHKSTMDKLSEQSVTVEREHTLDIVSLSHRPHLSDLLIQTVNYDSADWLFICSRSVTDSALVLECERCRSRLRGRCCPLTRVSPTRNVNWSTTRLAAASSALSL